jgi:hypothetical protein
MFLSHGLMESPSGSASSRFAISWPMLHNPGTETPGGNYVSVEG